MKIRRSGILLHISSLPGKYGIGSLGKSAYNFVDFLKTTHQTLWQILPLGYTGYGNSPYSSFSAFAGNPLLTDLGLLSEKLNLKLSKPPKFDNRKIDYEEVKKYKFPFLKTAAEKFLRDSSYDKTEYLKFLKQNEFWIDDFALFTAIKENNNNLALCKLQDKIRFRDKEYLQKEKNRLGTETEINKIIQYFFFEQWYNLKKYANDNEALAVAA